jgi:hypothetical protein
MIEARSVSVAVHAGASGDVDRQVGEDEDFERAPQIDISVEL